MRLALVALLLACGKPADPPTTGGSGSAPPAPPSGPAKKLGESCAADAECGTSMKCVKWTTEGGEWRATCEIPCGPKPDYTCPDGTVCIHQGGGPSGVCLKHR